MNPSPTTGCPPSITDVLHCASRYFPQTERARYQYPRDANAIVLTWAEGCSTSIHRFAGPVVTRAVISSRRGLSQAEVGEATCLVGCRTLLRPAFPVCENLAHSSQFVDHRDSEDLTLEHGHSSVSRPSNRTGTVKWMVKKVLNVIIR